MYDYQCVVIGAGPAGMMAAITAAKRGLKTALIEHMDKPGQKISITGNGKCNITNEALSVDKYYCKNPDFVEAVINKYDNADLCEFLESIGIFTKSKNGYVYPTSGQAESVREALSNYLYYAGVETHTKVKVYSITKNSRFAISADKGDYVCDNLIIATGSKAAPKTGSDGSGYELIKAFGVKINEPFPGLVALKSNSSVLKSIAGVRQDGSVNLYINDQLIKSEFGEIQFTEYGLSGIPTFQISRLAVENLSRDNRVKVIVDFSTRDRQELIDYIKSGREHLPSISSIQWINGIVNKKISVAIHELVGLPKFGVALRKLEDDQIEMIVDRIKKLDFVITGSLSFDNCQVCAGGIDVDEIDSSTMEIKKVKGLYAAGEIIDVDGICGGYNLQFAFSSGYIAGASLPI